MPGFEDFEALVQRLRNILRLYNGKIYQISFRFLPDSPVMTSTAAPVFENYVPLHAYVEPDSERTNISLTSSVPDQPGVASTSSMRNVGIDRDDVMCGRHDVESNTNICNAMLNMEAPEVGKPGSNVHRAIDDSSFSPSEPIPAPFCDIEITMADVQDNINSEQSYQNVIKMICEGNIYILKDPVVAGDELKCRVKSETDQNLSYLVTIKKKGMLSRKFKEKFKNYIYKCECPVKKVGSIISKFKVFFLLRS